MANRPPGPLRFADLEYGSLNNFGPSTTTVIGSGSKRRGTSKSFLHQALRDTYKKSALTGVNEFYGIVINMRSSDFISYRRKSSLFANMGQVLPGDDLPKPKDLFIYKVYIPEIECRPFPKDAFDPVIFTYPDVYSLPEVDANQMLAYGTIVRVTYSNVSTLTDPLIVATEGNVFLGFDGLDKQILEDMWKQQPTGILDARYTGPIPEAQRLIDSLESWGARVTISGELTTGGDLSPGLASAAISLFRTLMTDATIDKSRVTFSITSGNDQFHHGLKCVSPTDTTRRNGDPGRCYNSAHTQGNGLDFVIGGSVWDQRMVQNILRGYAAGSPNFRYLNEYAATGKKSAAATGDHFHLAWGETYKSHGDDNWGARKGSREEIMALVAENKVTVRQV